MHPIHKFAVISSFLNAALIGCVYGAEVEPTEIYTGGLISDVSPTLLRIATGGAGQSGLVEEIADAFIRESVKNGSRPFRIGWILSDTTYSIRHLQNGDADAAITYNPAAERIAGDRGIIDLKTYYLFRDHFLIVGPNENPAKLESSSDVSTIMANLHLSAENYGPNTTIATRWLSRYDKSATNIKESQLWLEIGQAPWATAYSTWYHQYIAFPMQALTTAIILKEYTLTDRGTYLSLPTFMAKQAKVYKAGFDNESDPLLLPGHLVIGKKAQNATLAHRFAEWVTGCDGQKVITNFKKNGQQLYSGAP